ncbi:MAG: response regulator, partial [Treponema sp.]|nr:response regulator [Treponema sp.]
MPWKLLIVDDEETICQGLGYMHWEELDCVVGGTARDGAEAIEWIKRSQPDIVITDIKMPLVNGIGVARYIHENAPWIKVIILTGYADFEYAHSAISYGVADYVLKPISKDTLIKSVKKITEEIARDRNNRKLSQEQIFRELAAGSSEAKKLEDRAAKCGIALDSFHATVFDAEENAFGNPLKRLDYIMESLSEKCPDDYVFSLDGRLFWLSRTGGEYPRRIVDICGEIINIGRLLYALFVSAGVSGRHHGLAELPAAVNEALGALGRNFYSNRSISFHEKETDTTPAKNVPALCTEELFILEKNLNDRNFDEVSQSLAALFSKLKCCAALEGDAKTVCVQVYYICTSVLIKNGLVFLPDRENGTSNLDAPAYRRLFLQIRGSRGITSLENAVSELLAQTVDILSNQGRTVSLPVKRALRYIHDNYHRSLSLEAIAGEIHINPSHLSRIFKKELGKPLTEYIN